MVRHALPVSIVYDLLYIGHHFINITTDTGQYVSWQNLFDELALILAEVV